MTTQEQCDKTATAAIKLGKMSEFAPVCDKHLTSHRQTSAKAGKKAIPKGATKAAAAQIAGANLDDEIPVLVRPLSDIEKANNLKCCNHLIDAGA
jgi:hypothetical protein